MAGLNYNPLSVHMASPGVGSPYVSGARKANQPGQFPQAPTSQTIGAESVRATGSGPFDSAYRQNLATFAGSQFTRPGGALQFNPTGLGQGFGAPTGGGNAPLTGMPQTLLGQAQGGQPLTPVTATQGAPFPSTFNPQSFWLEQYLNNGQLQGGANGYGA